MTVTIKKVRKDARIAIERREVILPYKREKKENIIMANEGAGTHEVRIKFFSPYDEDHRHGSGDVAYLASGVEVYISEGADHLRTTYTSQTLLNKGMYVKENIEDPYCPPKGKLEFILKAIDTGSDKYISKDDCIAEYVIYTMSKEETAPTINLVGFNEDNPCGDGLEVRDDEDGCVGCSG